jgi:hypothetical protein
MWLGSVSLIFPRSLEPKAGTALQLRKKHSQEWLCYSLEPKLMRGCDRFP